MEAASLLAKLQEQALALHMLVGFTTDREFMTLSHVTLPRRFLFGYQNYTAIML